MAEPAETSSAKHANTGLYIRSSAGLATRDKRIERLVRRVFEVLPHLTTADRPTVKAWAQIEYLADQVYAELRRNGVFTREMESRRLLDDFRKLRMAQLPYANALGLTPVARLAITASGKNAPVDLPALFAARDAARSADESESQPAGKETASDEG